jgi:hypothetical protein
MLPEIATLHEQMAKGGSWKEFQEKISELHKRATSQDEFVILLEAFANLRSMGPNVFDAETWSKLEKATEMGYRLFLVHEAMGGDQSINPLLYEYVTKREVKAGRLDPTSDIRTSSIAGASVLGDSSALVDRPSRPGNWLAGVLWFLGVREPVSPLWLIPLGFVLGWIPNENAKKRVLRNAKLKRYERGYPI